MQRLLVLLALTILVGSDCLAQYEVSDSDQVATSNQADNEVDVEQQRKQRTAATAMATLVGIALAGILLLFIVVLLGAWTRRRAQARAGAGETLDPASGGSVTAGDTAAPEAEPPDEDES